MSAFATVRYEQADGIAFITLDRPEVLNAFSVQMRDDLYEVFSAVRRDDDIRVLVVRGSGERAFCAGADLSEFLTAPSALTAREIRAMRDLWGLMRTVSQPIVCAMHGYVFGSGVEIALFCDLRIAADDTVFGLPETHLGILPGAGATQTVTRTVGLPSALALMLANRRMNVEEALRCGMVNHVVARENLEAATISLATSIADHPRKSVMAIKQLVLRGEDLSLPEGLRIESCRVDHAAANGMNT